MEADDSKLPDFPWDREAEWMLYEEELRPHVRGLVENIAIQEIERIETDDADVSMLEEIIRSAVEEQTDRLIDAVRRAFDASYVEPTVLSDYASELTKRGQEAFSEWIKQNKIKTLLQFLKYEVRINELGGS